MRGLDARAAAMIRIDAVWLAVEAVDMRAGADRLLAKVVQVFGGAQAHHGYLFPESVTPPASAHHPVGESWRFECSGVNG